ncbi:MAG: hypothetical protein AABZ31_01950 [Bdellovibrionota bacterium]
MEQNFWRKCSTCKKPISFNSRYYVCSVSSCNGQRTGYVFCSIQCFDAHIPGARHRDAGAIEQKAPGTSTAGTFVPTTSNPVAPTRRIITPTSGPASSSAQTKVPKDVLIIASRLKEYIDARSEGYNTSTTVMDVLSDFVRVACDRAIDNARADGRKTVMDRDFAFLKK